MARPASKAPGTTKATDTGPARSSSTLARLLRETEKELAALERRRTKLNGELVAAGADHEALARLGRDLVEVETELTATEERWLELGAEAER